MTAAKFLVVTGRAGIRGIPDTPIPAFGVSMDGLSGVQRGICPPSMEGGDGVDVAKCSGCCQWGTVGALRLRDSPASASGSAGADCRSQADDRARPVPGVARVR